VSVLAVPDDDLIVTASCNRQLNLVDPKRSIHYAHSARLN